MTQIGGQPAFPQGDRIKPVDFPSYLYPHPSIQTFTLGTVKEGIFHPNLPTFRRYDMDTAMHKLSDEHSQTTTRCSREDFEMARSSVFNREPQRINMMGVTAFGKEIHKHFTAPDELRCARLDWSEFLNRCPSRYKIRLPEVRENCCGNVEFSGYAVRYLRPAVNQAWKRPLDRYIPTGAPISCVTCRNRRSVFPF